MKMTPYIIGAAILVVGMLFLFSRNHTEDVSVRFTSNGNVVEIRQLHAGVGGAQMVVVFDTTVTAETHQIYLSQGIGLKSDSEDGFVLCVYDETGARTFAEVTETVTFLETDAMLTENGYVVEKGQTRHFLLRIELPEFDGSRGVRIQTLNFRFMDTDLQLTVPVQRAFDTGQIQMRRGIFLPEKKPIPQPTIPSQKGTAA